MWTSFKARVLFAGGLVGWTLAVTLGVILAVRPVSVVVVPGPPPAPQVVTVAADSNPPPPEYAMGWYQSPEEVTKSIAMMPTKFFTATAAGNTPEAAIPKFAYLWKAYEKLTGKPTPMKDQNPTGSCVGFGTTTAIERSLAVEISARVDMGMGDASEMALFSEEVTYAGSRVEANGGRCPIPAREDGSNGSWAARWTTTGGMLPKAKYGRWDMTFYDAARAHSWNGSGVPDELEPEAKKFIVGDAVRITNWEDAKKSLANGYAIAECSNILFGRQRNAKGIAQPDGRGGHCMCLDGYHVDVDGKEYGHIENSWSGKGSNPQNYHIGPTGWGNPTGAGFWADARIIDSMLKEGDSWAYSGAHGFPRQDIDWLGAMNVVPRRNGIEVASILLPKKVRTKCVSPDLSLSW